MSDEETGADDGAGEADELNFVLRARREKLAALEARGVAPFGYAFDVSHSSAEAVGAFGPLSCTPTGLGGELGCTAKMIEAAYAERANSNSVRMAELVAQAREERMSTIDEQAAATQARVEQIEREYMERIAREEAAASGRPLPHEDENPDLVSGEGE